jgi:hypothetical protein
MTPPGGTAVLRRLTLLTTLSWLLLAPAAPAQDRITIKFKEPGQGESLRVEIKDTSNYKSITTVEKEKEPRKEEFSSTKHLLYTETVQERLDPAKPATKVKRVYEKAINEGTGALAKTKAPPYHGKTVLIEKKGDKYEFRIEGGDVFQDAELEAEFNFDLREQDRQKKIFVAPVPVVVGDSWKVDPRLLLGDFDKKDVILVTKNVGTAKLSKLYKKDGRQYGVIDAVLEVEFTLLPPKGAKQGEGLTSTSRAVMRVSFDGCIDGTFAEGTIKGTADFGGTNTVRMPNVPTVTSVSTGTSTVEDSWKELPRK